MRNTELEEAQAGIKSAGRNINNLRYADDTTIINLSAGDLMLLNCGVGEDSWESLGLQGDPTSPS